VRALRCTDDAGCSPIEELEVGAMLAEGPDERRPMGITLDVHATQMDGKLLVLWRSRTRGLRFRVGAAKEIVKAPDRVLYDDRLSDGIPFAMSLLHDVTLLLPRHDATLVFLQTMGTTPGIKAFRVAPDGAFATLD
jgi:hypothetical protein